MIMNDDLFDKIEAWLSAKLPEAQALAFEAEMAADAALAAEVERHRRSREGLNRLAEQALQGDMARWRASMDELPAPPVDTSPTNGRINWIIVGALGLILLGGVYWLWPSNGLPPGQPPIQENPPTQTQPIVPIPVTPPEIPKHENKDVKQPADPNSAQLIALAETHLNDLHTTILQQYSQTLGDEDEENPAFTAGVTAFKQHDLKTAKKEMLLVLKTDPYFPSAQEMLAFIYLSEKNYPSAVQCYEVFAKQTTDPTADWYLLQFYLADYQHHKADFAKKLRELTAPGNQHRYQKEAERLKLALEGIGVK